LKALTIEEKIEIIIEKSEMYDVTAYEFGKKTTITTGSARTVLNKENKNPRNKTLNIMLDYLEQVAMKSEVKEPTERYEINKKLEDRIADKVFERMSKMDDKLDFLIDMMSRISTTEERTKTLAMLNEIDEIEEKNNER
jgi:tRNA C32,U32 (ribose-2'-O)-methylase TrmJ